MTELAIVSATDTVRLPAPVGMRFRDSAAGRFVGRDLAVTVERDVPLARTYRLDPTPSGHWVNQALYDAYRGLPADPQAWDPEAREHRVAADDQFGQYLPLRFTGKLPRNSTFAWAHWPNLAAAKYGPLIAPGGTVSPAPGYLPLFPGSAYSAGPLARVYAHLAFYEDDDHITDASWALMTVSLGTTVVGVGLSDARGAIGTFFPYPLVPDLSAEQKTKGRADVTWTVSVAVHTAKLAASPVPDLADILAQLATPPHFVHATLATPATALSDQSLILGQPLVLRTATDADHFASSLYLKTP